MTPEEIQTFVNNQIDARAEQIAEAAAKKALELVYAELGKGIVTKLLWIVGIVAYSILTFMAGRWVKIP